MPIIGIAGDGSGLPVAIAILTDDKADLTAGGTFTTGAWRTRTLNTKRYDPASMVSLSGNQFTLGPGTYEIEWTCPAYDVSGHQTRLYDVTGSAQAALGSVAFCPNTSGIQTISTGSFVVTIAANNTYRIEHICQVTVATYGFGTYCGFGVGEVYSQVTIRKIL